MPKQIIAYTNGYFDLFHIGHLNLLKCASALCDKLIVGVLIDQLSQVNKKKLPVIPFVDRMEIVRAIKGVDVVVPVGQDDKFSEWKKYHYDILVVGSDHQRSHIWNRNESEIRNVGSNVIYIPYTESVSSTKIREDIKK